VRTKFRRTAGHAEARASSPARYTKWDGETVARFAFLHPDTSLKLVREVLARTER
jgi:hypothetical protein